MNKIIQGEEIDLLQFLKSCWKEKIVIALSIVLSFILSFILIVNLEKKYETNLNIILEQAPPFMGSTRATNDFQKLFLAKKTFEKWSAFYGNSIIAYKDFDNTTIIDGYPFKDKKKNLIRFDRKKGSIKIKSKNPALINDVYKYSQFVNDELTTNYVKRSRIEINFIETKFKDFAPNYEANILSILKNDRFLYDTSSGAKIFIVEKPDIPEKVAPNIYLITLVFLILGSIVGVIIAITRF